MLDGAGVSHSMGWEEAMKLIINNPTYRVIPTLNERKAAFFKWRELKAKEEKEKERQRQRQIKVDFVKILSDCPELTSRTRFHRAVELFGDDPRWLAVEDELAREELYEEYSLSLERKEAAERRAVRKEKMADFKALLLRSGVNARSQWRKVQADLEDEPALAALEKIDRLAVYEEVVRAFEAEEEQKRQAVREAERRKQRKMRDAFRQLLVRKHQEGVFNARTRWRDVEKLLSECPEYAAALEQPGSTVSEMYEDYVEQLNEQWQAQRKTLKALMTALHGTFSVTLETSAEDFESALRGADDGTLADVPQSAISAYFEELRDRLLKEKSDEERRVERAKRQKLEGYQGSLRGLMGALLGPTTPYEEAAAMMAGKAATQGMSDEEQRQAFDELIESLRADEAAEAKAATDAEEERQKRKKEKRERERREREHRRELGEDVDEEEEARRKRKKEKKAKRSRFEEEEPKGEDEAAA